MAINDKVFGELEYDFVWSGETSISFLGKNINVGLFVSGDEDGIFEKEQYHAYSMLMDKWEEIHPKLLPEILEYYKNERAALGYDIEPNDDYPLIDNIDELIEHIDLVGINVLYQGAFGGKRNIGLAFDCSWDNENGLGIRLLDENIHKIGYQDVSM